LAFSVEGITLQITRVTPQGEVLDQARMNSTLRILPPNRSTILATTFQTSMDVENDIQLNLLSAVQVSNPEARAVPIDINLVKLEKLQNDQLYRFRGQVNPVDEPVESSYAINIQVNGYSLSGDPIGTNTLQINALPEELPLEFSLDLFSLNGPIHEYEILAEALPFAQDP
jgi:hypothetical protein